ncbi:SubName: Full=Uncharacterized protein {ECO:0000313/EMBL:CCA70313.1} [Serendipita indica DSM 11827]|nr:SubName: Full=Uncharacterized protein {ECO:0000313/EMBL:CCA70313.1} [Serendipita indica DSM 11827]
MPPKQGATLFLLVHFVVKASVNRIIRSFSVTEDFEPGGHPFHFAQMDFDTRTALENIWKQLDFAYRPNFDPLAAVFSLYKCAKLPGASGWENYVAIFQCSGAKPLRQDPRQPWILCHLSKDASTGHIMLKHQFMIARDYDLGALPASYDWLDGDWRKAVKDQLARVNNFEEDASKHPWALKKMYRTVHNKAGSSSKQILEGISLIVEWQGCEPVSIEAI